MLLQIKSNIQSIDSITQNIPDGSFDFTNQNGELVTSQLFGLSKSRIFFEEQDNRKFARIEFVPKRTGTYYVAFISTRETLTGESIDFDPTCKHEIIDLSYTTNNAINNNFDMYISTTQSEDVAIDDYNKYGGFTFRVVE